MSTEQYQFHSESIINDEKVVIENEMDRTPERRDDSQSMQGMNCVDNLVWNTDLIETIKLENLFGPTTQSLYSGEVRHESW